MKKNEVNLSFIIRDFNDINHDDITQILNILPGKVIVKGEKRNPNNPTSPLFTQNAWIMKSHLGKYAEFEDQMNELLDIIESKLAEFKAICNKYYCEFSCAIYVYFDNGESTPWVHLNERYNRLNQELNIEFDVDLYVLPAKD